MTNCFDINLSLNPLKEDIDIKSYGTNAHTPISITDININLILLLYKLGLKIQLVELFHTSSHSFTTIHTDAAGGDYTKMNFIYGGKNSKMIWYRVKSDSKKPINSTNIGTPYIGHELTEVDLIEECSVKFPSIIQVGIPHNILNYEEPRYCLSIVLAKTLGGRITMNESLNIFKSYIVI
jgi:hypothetical protein